MLSVDSLFPPLPTLNVLSGIPQEEQTSRVKIINTTRLDSLPLFPNQSCLSLHDILKIKGNKRQHQGHWSWSVDSSEPPESTHQTLSPSKDRLDLYNNCYHSSWGQHLSLFFFNNCDNEMGNTLKIHLFILFVNKIFILSSYFVLDSRPSSSFI